MNSMTEWEQRFASYVAGLNAADGAHDSGHVQRVVVNARRLAASENADLNIVLPAAWLHDCVAVAKDSPLRSQASRLAAEQGVALLSAWGYDLAPLPAIGHAIAAHSFSAGIPPETIEAKVVQDADRLEALGAIGLLRMVITGCQMGRELFDNADPLALNRQADDGCYTLDHLQCKLYKLPAMMQTAAGRREAEARCLWLRAFSQQLATELGVSA